MGVYIKGMKIPKECGECRWFHFRGEPRTCRKKNIPKVCPICKEKMEEE